MGGTAGRRRRRPPGSLNGVLLAVIALIPLVAFELMTDLPTASQTLQRVRRAAARTLDVIGAQPPILEPADSLPLPPSARTIRVRGLNKNQIWRRRTVGARRAGPRSCCRPNRRGDRTQWRREIDARRRPAAIAPLPGASVTLGGVEISDLCGDEYRRVIGLVSQDAHIFDTTLEENLRLARRDASLEEIRESLRRVRLLDWIESLPDGLATPVGAHGARISGGQRQRLAVARALLADFPVLVVDEPGEHLDTATADALMADLIEATPQQALLLITHRLAGMDAVDEVIVLDSGRAVERGTHAELLATCGHYARMWARETEERSLL